MEIDRQPALPEPIQERPQALGRALIDLTLGGDPFAATLTAGIRFAFGEVEYHRQIRRVVIGFWRRRGGGSRNHQRNDSCDDEWNSESHGCDISRLQPDAPRFQNPRLESVGLKTHESEGHGSWRAASFDDDRHQAETHRTISDCWHRGRRAAVRPARYRR